DRILVVAEPGDIRGADFAKDGATDAHDLRDAEAAADLDELPARDDYLFAETDASQDDDGGGGIVVDGRGAFATVQPAKLVANGQRPRRAFAGFQVEFEIEITGGGFKSGVGGGDGRGRAADIGVQHDARAVDDWPEFGLHLPAETLDDTAGHQFGGAGAIN